MDDQIPFFNNKKNNKGTSKVFCSQNFDRCRQDLSKLYIEHNFFVNMTFDNLKSSEKIH